MVVQAQVAAQEEHVGHVRLATGHGASGSLATKSGKLTGMIAFTSLGSGTALLMPARYIDPFVANTTAIVDSSPEHRADLLAQGHWFGDLGHSGPGDGAGGGPLGWLSPDEVELVGQRVPAAVWDNAVAAPAASGVSARGPPIRLLDDSALHEAGVDGLEDKLLAWAFPGRPQVFMYRRVYQTILVLITAGHLPLDYLERVLDYEQRRRIEQQRGPERGDTFDDLAENLKQEYTDALNAATTDMGDAALLRNTNSPRTSAAPTGQPAPDTERGLNYRRTETSGDGRVFVAPLPGGESATAGVLQRHFDELGVRPELLLRERAFFLDPVTGLFNDRGFRALERDAGRPFLASWELEGGKFFNDAHGHEAFDGALRIMARVLAESGVRDGAKLGGAIFAWVSGPVQAEATVAAMTAAVGDGVQVTTAVVRGRASLFETLDATREAHRAVRDELVAAGRMGHRKGAPLAFLDVDAPAIAYEEGMAGLAPTSPRAGEILAVAAQRSAGTAKRFGQTLPVTDTPLTPAHLREFEGFGGDLFAALYFTFTRVLSAFGFAVVRELSTKRFVASADMRGLKALNEAFGKAGANMVLRAFGEELAVNDGGRFDVAHLHGDEFAAQSDDRVALDGFLRDVQAVVNRLVFYQERADGQVVMQEGVYFAYGIGATFDEADRVALPRAKELQGDVPEPRVLSAVDAVAAIAELQDRGHRVVRIDPAFDSSAGRSGTGSDSKTGEVLQDILDEPLEASSPTTSNEHSWDRHPRPLVSFAAAARGGGWSLFGEAAVALGVAVMGVLFFGGPGVVVAEVMAAIVSPMLVMLLHHVWAHGPPRARAAIGFVVKAVVVLVVIAAILALAGSEAGADPATPGVARGPASGDPWVLAVPAVDVAPVAAFVETVAGPVMLVAVLAVAALAAAIVVVVIKRVSKYRQTGTSDDGRSFVLDREQPRFGGTQRILQVREVRTGDVYLFKEAGIDLRFGVMREAVAMAIAAESRRPVAPFAKGVFGGKTGLYQVKLASRSDLAGRPISSCPLTILLDLVRSHVQDYAMRNADAIPEHFLVMPNGNGVLEVDLGRAWKVWPADKLTVAEWTGTLRSAVYYELFDRIANGEYSVQTVDALYQASMEQVRWTESVSDEFWVDRLVQAFEQLPVGSPLRHRQDEFIAQELARKHGLDVAFSEFWRGIYNKLGHPMPSREGPVTQAGAIRDRR